MKLTDTEIEKIKKDIASKPKDKKAKRVFPNRYRSDVSGRGAIVPNADKLSEYHRSVQSTVGPKNNMEPMQNNTFMQEVPKTKARTRELQDFYVIHDKKGDAHTVPVRNTPRELVETKVATVEAFRSDRLQGFVHWFWKTLSIGPVVYRIGCGGNCWKLRKIYTEQGYYMESIGYSSKERAVSAFATTAIRWKADKIPLASWDS